MDKKAVLKTTLGRKPSFRMMTALLLLGVLIPSISSISLADIVDCSPGYVGIPRAESTDVSGIISEDTVWTLAGSPYIVVGDVVVEPNATLTIEAGVVVKFTAGKNLVIDASGPMRAANLIAKGNATHDITFTSNASIPAPGDWGSVRIRASGWLQYVPTSLDYLVVEYGSTGIYFESGLTNRSITHSAFRSNIVGLRAYAADIGSRTWFMDDCEISNNTDCGVFIDWAAVLDVHRSLFSGNGEGLVSQYGQLSMEDCNVTNNQGPGVWQTAPAHIMIKNSDISSNNGCGIHGILAGGWPGITAENTIISNNNGDGINSPEYEPQGPVTISGCNITGNKGTGVVNTGSLSILDSIVSGNDLAGLSSESISMISCTVKENGGVGIYTGSGSVHYSNLYDNQQYDVRNSGGSSINATYNWWGTTNETLITERIFGEILFNPFLTAPVEGDVISPTIRNVDVTPEVPNYDEGVVVSASITDNKGVNQASLSYTSELSWHNVSMNRLDNAFDAAIPAQPYGTLVQYKIYANDTSNNWATSGPYSYTVGDFVPPEVKLSRIPDYPLPGQKVKVYANVTEPTNASGVKSPVYFSYRVNSGSWLNTTMTFNIGLDLYETTIQDYEKHDIVEYLVKALDNAGNTNTTIIQHYEVLRCDVNHNGVVDAPDLYMIGQAWNTRTGEPGFIAGADINEDGIIDATDLTILNTQYGKDP